MPFLAPEMQQDLAGILAAILWTYFQGGRMCFKEMKSDEIELLRSDWEVLPHIRREQNSWRQNVVTDLEMIMQPVCWAYMQETQV